MAFNLLSERIIEAEDDGRLEAFTLPELFEAWQDRPSLTLTGMRAHQRYAVYLCFVQLAVGALLLSDDGLDIAVDADIWRDRLLGLAPETAWDIVPVSDDVPGFLQPVIHARDSEKIKTAYSPDELTVLRAAKNHCVKQNIVDAGTPWIWACALIEMQTTIGYTGRDNFGIARMNGGFGSRAMVANYKDLREGARWGRDVTRYVRLLLDDQELSAKFSGDARKGVVATWTLPWDGIAQIQMKRLHHTFVETARRVRLQSVDAGNALIAKIGNSSVARTAFPEELCGRMGDPWVPLDGDGKVLTMSGNGFSLHVLRNLITPDSKSVYRQSAFQKVSRTDVEDRGDIFFYGAVLVSGQGKTDGYHEISLPIPGHIAFSLFDDDFKKTIGVVAAEMHEKANRTRGILRTALKTFCDQENQREDGGDKVTRYDEWMRLFDRRIQDEFFASLWLELDRPDRTAWHTFVKTTAEHVFEEAVHALPVHQELFYRCYSRGRSALDNLLKSIFEPKQEKVAA